MKIELTPEQIEAIEKLNDRYYFGLFQPICKEKDEEYQFRNVIQEIVDQINRQRLEKLNRGWNNGQTQNR